MQYQVRCRVSSGHVCCWDSQSHAAQICYGRACAQCVQELVSYTEAKVRWLHVQAFHDAGWTRQEVINIPNALSMGRLLSGPVVAHMILQHHWPAAMVTLAIAGISDWADGYAAKHWGQSSVLGSYLDPLADKVLIGCTVGALAAEVCVSPSLRLCSEASNVAEVASSLRFCSDKCAAEVCLAPSLYQHQEASSPARAPFCWWRFYP